MLGAHIVVAQLQCLSDGVLKRRLGPRGEGQLSFLRLRPSVDLHENLRLDQGSGDAGFCENLASQAIGKLEECEEKVLGSHESVPEPLRLLHRLCEDGSGPVSESFVGRDVEGESLMGCLLAHTERTADL